jgi:hypothetical protein
MPDLSHEFGQDLQLSATNDLLTNDGVDLGRQRIIRRLLTAVKGYLWHLTYGAGVPQMVGKPYAVSVVASFIRAQIKQEASVAASPPPKITVTQILNGVSCTILYYDSGTGKQKTLSFDATQ